MAVILAVSCHRPDRSVLAHETHSRLGGEAEEQNRMIAHEACSHISVQRSAFVRNLSTDLSVATLKDNATVSQPPGPKDGKSFSKSVIMPTCRSRINLASH